MENKFSLAQNWFTKANNDLKNADLILSVSDEDKPFDTVCFHCQQVAEKYLKGLLIILEIPFPKTHNIEVLIDLISPVYPDIERFETAVSLTYYAVENRYPDDYTEILEDEAREAHRLALEIKLFIEMKIADMHNGQN